MLQFFYKVYADKIGHQKPLRRHFSNKQKMRCAAIANNIKQKIKKRLYWHVHFKYVANQISLNVTPAVDRPSAEIIFQWWRPNVTAHGVQVQALSGNHWYWFDTVPKCVLWWENDLKKGVTLRRWQTLRASKYPTLYGSTLLCITSSDVVNPLFTSMEMDRLSASLVP